MNAAAARTRVKFCGFTRVADAERAAALGADAIGLVFAPRSPRRVDADAARAIVAALPPFVTAVGLFLDAEAAFVREVLARAPLALLQFHGREDAGYCRSFQRPWIKAVAMGDAPELAAEMRRYEGACGFLLDSHVSGGQGGSGQRFDWSRVPASASHPLILAGGLTVENVGEAVRRVRPYGVDVSSGIEASPGIKDHDRMQLFIDEVARAGSQAG